MKNRTVVVVLVVTSIVAGLGWWLWFRGDEKSMAALPKAPPIAEQSPPRLRARGELEPRDARIREPSAGRDGGKNPGPELRRQRRGDKFSAASSSRLKPLANQGPRPLSQTSVHVVDRTIRQQVFHCARQHQVQVPRGTRVTVMVDLQSAVGGLTAKLAQADIHGHENPAYVDCVTTSLKNQVFAKEAPERFDLYQMSYSYQLR